MRLRNVSNGYLPDLHEIDLMYALYERIHKYNSGQSNVGLEDEEFYDKSLTQDASHVISTGRLIKDILIHRINLSSNDKSIAIFVNNEKYLFGLVEDGETLEADIIISINSDLSYKKIKADVLSIINGSLDVKQLSSYYRSLVIIDEIDVESAYIKGGYIITNYFGGKITKIATEISAQNTLDIEEHIVFERDKKQVTLDSEDLLNILKSLKFIIYGAEQFLHAKKGVTIDFDFVSLTKSFPGLYDDNKNVLDLFNSIDDSALFEEEGTSYVDNIKNTSSYHVADDSDGNEVANDSDQILDDVEQHHMEITYEDFDKFKDAELYEIKNVLTQIIEEHYKEIEKEICSELLLTISKDELIGMLKFMCAQKPSLASEILFAFDKD